MSLRSASRNLLALATMALVAACAASKQEAASPAAQATGGAAQSPQAAPQSAAQYAAPADQAPQAGYPQQPAPPPPKAPAAPPAEAPGTSTTTPSVTPAAPGAPAPARAAQIARAGSELDRAQRELEVAAGDCQNACRALGSMDRAAGHLCDLVQGAGELRKCEDAKKRVLGARDRVKQTCGTCPNGPSVERNDPVPSTR